MVRTRQARWLKLLAPVALAIGLVTHAFGPAMAQTATGDRFEGVLAVVWGDPRPGNPGGTTLFRIGLADGTRVPLEIAPAQRNTAIQYFGKRVAVRGRMSDGADGARSIAVDQIELAEPAKDDVQPAVVTRKVLYILLKFRNDSQTPHLPAFFLNLTNPQGASAGIPATINGFYNKTSWGKLQWSATVAKNKWYTLPKTKTQYANCGWSGVCANLDQIGDDAITLVQADGINVSVYDNINFVLNNDLDCCAWGGSFFTGGKLFGATWEPPWGQETGTYVHEFGHSIGLPHSGWVYYAYDSPWDEMSSGSPARSVQCGSYRSANSGNQTQGIFCTEPGAGYITPYKAFLGWLPPANMFVINSRTTVTKTLVANSQPLGTGIKMIKVCLASTPCTGGSAHYITVEARVRGAQYEKGLPGEGIIIHDFRGNRPAIGGSCFFNSQSGWAVPIDATPNDYNRSGCNSGGRTWPNYALGNAQLAVGRTYTNSTLGVTVTVLGRPTATTFNVRVSRTR